MRNGYRILAKAAVALIVLSVLSVLIYMSPFRSLLVYYWQVT